MQAIAQSATQLTISNAAPDWTDNMFVESAERACSRNAKGVTRERQTLNRNKLVSSVCADYRAHFAAMYGKTDRLPSETYERIEQAVETVINRHLQRVNSSNAIGFRRAFFHNHKEMEVTERVIATGENKLSLQEQHCGIVIFIGQAEKRLKELEAKKTPDYEREKEVKATIMRLNITKQFIEGEIAHQNKVVAETQTTKPATE